MYEFYCEEGIRTEIDNVHFPFKLVYHTFGKLNQDGSNIKWVFHALTANSNVADWWNGALGENLLLDPEKDFIICVNMPGSCYGSTSPFDINPATKEKYYHDFPLLTVKDIVLCFKKLKDHLGLGKIFMGLGGSMGGSVLLEWNVSFPDDFENTILVATSAQESSWGKAIHTVHKMAIETDPSWKNRSEDAGIHGLETARGVGMLFYRTYESFNRSQIDDIDAINNYKSDSYIRYQGKKLVRRFNAFSYHYLLETLDSHNVGRNRGSLEDALQKVKSKCLIIGIDSDILYPEEEQRFLHEHIPNNEFYIIESEYGHDGFLIETEKINKLSLEFLNK